MSELIIKDTGVIARAELDTQISTAKAYPRDVKKSIEYALQLATMDEETAASCFYVLPRKEKDGTKKEIKGGSIRLAEIMASAWGNIHAATRIIENDGKHITAEGVAWDLESNVKITMQNKVSIIFGAKDGKGGYTANPDMQTVLSNAASAKALRNAIFKVIPKALIDRILEKSMSFSIGDQKSKRSKIDTILERLNKMGIDQEKILNYYEKKSKEDLTDDNIKSLIGLGTAIKEGHIKIDDVFKSQLKETNDNASDLVNELLINKKPIDSFIEEVKIDSLIKKHEKDELKIDQSSMYEQVKKQLMKAKSQDTLDLAADMIREVEEEKQQELRDIYKQKLESFK